MAGELFDRIDADNAARLRAAGWHMVELFGEERWCPPGTTMLHGGAVAMDEALRRVEREEQKRGEA